MIGLFGLGGTRSDYLSEARRELYLARCHIREACTGGKYESVYAMQAARCIERAGELRAQARAATVAT